jgi:SAM-dependent methyltransferase
MSSAGPADKGQQSRAGTVVARGLNSRLAVEIASRLPVPLAVARPFLLHDNEQENLIGGWGRLRDPAESPRYETVRRLCEKYARDGFVLDVGCSQGILQEGLAYSRYVGIDSHEQTVLRAAIKADDRTSFEQATADTYRPDQPPDAVVFNEMLYYLPNPLKTVQRYANLLAPGGVLIVSVYLRTWATRRMLRQISKLYPVSDCAVTTSRPQLAWIANVYRPRSKPHPFERR